MAEKQILTQYVIRQLLTYNLDTGHFFWLPRDETILKNKSWNSRLAGRQAGAIKRSTGYVSISLFNCGYLAHRLAFLWVDGAMPKDQVDHANGKRSDNRWSNLRNATRQQNNWNVLAHGSTGKKGVSWHKRDQKFQALIRVDGRNRSLGYFDTPEAAEMAYNNEAERLRGEFAHHLR